MKVLLQEQVGQGQQDLTVIMTISGVSTYQQAIGEHLGNSAVSGIIVTLSLDSDLSENKIYFVLRVGGGKGRRI
mgnify:CR=1 FL=1